MVCCLECYWGVACVAVFALSVSFPQIDSSTKRLLLIQSRCSETKDKGLKSWIKFLVYRHMFMLRMDFARIPYFFGRYVLGWDLKPEVLCERESYDHTDGVEEGAI